MKHGWKKLLAVLLCLLTVSLCACSAAAPESSAGSASSGAASSEAGPEPESDTPSKEEPEPPASSDGESSENTAPPEEKNEDYLYETGADGSVVLTKYVGDEADPVTPATVEGKPVSAIGEGCFQGLIFVRSVTVSEGVGAIGDYAFECCCALQKAVLPKTLKTLGDGAFSGCVRLSALEMPSVEKIGRGAFLYAKRLTAVSFPENLTEMGEFAFAACSSLETADFGDAAIETLPDRAFYGCSALSSLTLPKNLSAAGKRAFSGCEKLGSLSFPKPIAVSEHLFENCSALSELSLEPVSIGDGGFSGCGSLSSLSMEGVSSIGYSAFSGTRITELEIPASVREIKGGAFFNANLDSVTLAQGSPFTIADGALLSGDGKTMIAYLGEPREEFTVPEGVEELGAYAFALARIDKVILPDSVRKIGAFAFRYSSVLTLEKPEGIELDPDAFRESGLEEQSGEAPGSYEELSIDEIGSYAGDKNLFDEEEFRDYAVIENDDFAAWSEEYLAFCEEAGNPLNEDTMHYILLYKGEVVPHFLGMTSVQNRDPEMLKEAADAFGDDFESMYLMMDHGLFTELRRGKMNEDLVLYTGVYDSQLMAAAKTETVPTIDQLVDSIGGTFSDPIMTSTTTDPGIACGFGETLFIIYASKDALCELGAVCIDAAIHTNEKEILLCEKASYEILDVGAFQVQAQQWDGSTETFDRYYVKLRLLGSAS